MLPVDPTTLGAFTVAVLAIVVSPGPDTLLILRYTLSSGQRVGLATVFGVQMGIAVHTLMAVLGISFIIASSPVLFRAVAVAGALYLAWLGFQGFKEGGALDVNGKVGRGPVGARKACRDAVLTNLLNPKVILLFLALFPNFVDTGRGDVTAQLLTLAAALVIINVAWQAPIAWTADRVRRWLDRPGTQRMVSRTTGVIFIAFAVMMLYEHLF